MIFRAGTRRYRASIFAPSRSFRPRFGLRERLRDRERLRSPPLTLMRFSSTRFSESPSSNSISNVSSLRARVTLPLYHFPLDLKSASTRSPSRGFFERFGLRLRLRDRERLRELDRFLM